MLLDTLGKYHLPANAAVYAQSICWHASTRWTTSAGANVHAVHITQSVVLPEPMPATHVLVVAMGRKETRQAYCTARKQTHTERAQTRWAQVPEPWSSHAVQLRT